MTLAIVLQFIVVLLGFFPELLKLPGAKRPLAMPIVIEIVMMSVAAAMLLVTKVNVNDVPKTPTLRAGVVATAVAVGTGLFLARIML